MREVHGLPWLPVSLSVLKFSLLTEAFDTLLLHLFPLGIVGGGGVRLLSALQGTVLKEEAGERPG